ncbi:helix-hairpin-helix domain-containing protein [candidate division WOR-3 bacterium]|nr:helix-hairpin-helix domain-containing protein [candidate division WOR-3 bacterium]
MGKREILVLVILIAVLIALNIVNYVKKENLKKNYTVLIEEIKVQISINDVDAGELEDLPGIGPSLANRIVEYRNMHGRFENLENLKNVKGIGNKLFQKILPFIKL